ASCRAVLCCPSTTLFGAGEMEVARASVMKAQQLLDEGSAGAKLMVSVAKAKAGRAAGLAVREGVQMHGGIGMTDEYDIGLYMKRDRKSTRLNSSHVKISY